MKRAFLFLILLPAAAMISTAGAAPGESEYVVCVACHAVHGTGGTVGPDLAEATSRLNEAEMLEHIIVPSKHIDPKFQIHTIRLETGEAVYGRIVKRNAAAVDVVENPLSEDPPRVIPTSRVADITAAKISTMPAGLLDTLERRQILDLLAYIRAGGGE